MNCKDIPTIVWDIDDVLNDLMRQWFEQEWCASRPDCTIRYEDLHSNPPHEYIGASKGEYLASLDSFRLSAEAERMTPDLALLTWFHRYGANFRHVALTARPTHTAAAAFAWTIRHFGQWIQTLSFVPSARAGVVHSGPDHSKAGFLSWLGKVDVFIDDSPANVEAARRLGVRALLVKQPWNQSDLGVADILDILSEDIVSKM